MSTEVFVTVAATVVCALVAYIWHDLVKRVRELTNMINTSTQAVLAEKIRRLEGDYRLLHMWKNSVFPSIQTQHSKNILNVVYRIEAEVQRRLDKLERDGG